MISRANGTTGRTFKATMLFAWLIALPCVVWGIGKLEFKPGFNLFSLTEDVQVEKEGSAQIDKQVPLLNDAPTLQYVSDLERKLIAFAPNNHAEYVWQIKLVNRSEINAFALPGGYIYVNRGLIETAENEAQLAGALAHESGHVVMRHGTHNASQAMLAQMPLEFLSGMLGQGGSLAGPPVRKGISLGLNSMMLKNSRSAESQADDVGTYILYEAGYDPRALAQFFQIIGRKY